MSVRTASPTWSHRQAGQRIQALRNREYLRCGGAESRAALHPRHPQPIGSSVCHVDPGSGRSLSLRSPHPCGDGQSQYSLPEVSYRPPRRQQGRYLWSRLKVHYTPKHGSWLNQAEIELSLMSRQCLGTRRIPTLDLLKSEVRSWNAQANRDQTRIQWKFTRKAARVKFGYKRNTSKRSRT